MPQDETVIFQTPYPTPSIDPAEVPGAEQLVRAEVSFTVTEPGTALEQTQQHAQVETEQTSYGAMVTSLNDQTSNAEYYWALYLNGQYAQAGAADLQVQPGDTVTWKLEKIEQ